MILANHFGWHNRVAAAITQFTSWWQQKVLQHILILQSYIPSLRDPACMRMEHCLCNLSSAPLLKLQWLSY